jgi:hypothetical protein
LKKISYIWVALILAAALPVKAQQDTVIIEQDVQQVSLDPLSNIFLITKDFEFRKYNSKGVLEYFHSDLQLTAMSKISSNHAFKSMIYYPEYGFIRVFGNRLQILAELNLNNFNFGEITAVAPSIGYQSFWIFDATEQKLIKINQNAQVEKESVLLNILDAPFFPNQMLEYEGWIYAYDPNNGLYIFDNSGIYSKSFPISEVNSFSVINENIFVSKGGQLFQLDAYLKKLMPLNVNIDGKIIHLSFRKMVVKKNGMIKVLNY